MNDCCLIPCPETYLFQKMSISKRNLTDNL
nr:MAG TPA: hypothetical protein [Caudoviricetes sp.]